MENWLYGFGEVSVKLSFLLPFPGNGTSIYCASRSERNAVTRPRCSSVTSRSPSSRASYFARWSGKYFRHRSLPICCNQCWSGGWPSPNQMEWKRLTETTVVCPDVAVRLLTECPPTRLVLTGRRAAASAHAHAVESSYRVRTETNRRNSDTSVDSRSIVYRFAPFPSRYGPCPQPLSCASFFYRSFRLIRTAGNGRSRRRGPKMQSAIAR